MNEPIITREAGRQTITTPAGRTIDVDEIVTLDYGKKGKTTVYIRPPEGTRRIDAAGINAAVARFGVKLAPMQGA